MTSPTPQSERRRSVRALATFSVRLSQTPNAEPALLRDISEIGMACTAAEAVPEMTLVGLDFSLPGASDVHHVRGAVVRCERLRPDKGPSSKASKTTEKPAGKAAAQWDLAVYFTEITPVTRAALRNYIGKAKKAP